MADTTKIEVKTSLTQDLGNGREKTTETQTIEKSREYTRQGSGEITLSASQADYQFFTSFRALILQSKVESNGTYKTFEVNMSLSTNDAITTQFFAYDGASDTVYLTNPDNTNPITILYTYQDYV